MHSIAETDSFSLFSSRLIHETIMKNYLLLLQTNKNRTFIFLATEMVLWRKIWNLYSATKIKKKRRENRIKNRFNFILYSCYYEMCLRYSRRKNKEKREHFAPPCRAFYPISTSVQCIDSLRDERICKS